MQPSSPFIPPKQITVEWVLLAVAASEEKKENAALLSAISRDLGYAVPFIPACRRVSECLRQLELSQLIECEVLLGCIQYKVTESGRQTVMQVLAKTSAHPPKESHG